MNNTYDFKVQPPVMFSQLAADDLLFLHYNYLPEPKYESFSSLYLKRNFEPSCKTGRKKMLRHLNY